MKRKYVKKQKPVELLSVDKVLFDKLLKVATIVKPPK